MKGNLKTIVIYLVIFAILMAVCFAFLNNKQKQEKIGYGEVLELFDNNKVVEFSIDGTNILTIKTTETSQAGTSVIYTHKLRSIELFSRDIDEYLKAALDENSDSVLDIEKCDIEALKETPWIVAFLPGIIIAVILIVFYIYMMNKAGDSERRMNAFGKSRAKMHSKEKNRKFFSDVAGCDEEKEELRELVEYLRDPAKFRKLGAKIPHGVLLVGPPGTGKTLLAKAVAGEADVPFFSISGSDFVEMYVGVGASRVRDLFETARKAPASIVFIDEIDAVGRHRGAGLGGGHDEREQTLNQLLVDMDGFGAHEGIIVMAATNRPDILDPALLRPGRFDRQITVNYPDIKGREEILHVHARGKKFEDEVDFEKIAQTTAGFTGADLQNLLNEAALLAVRRGKSLIGMEDIEDSFIKVIAGPQKKSMKRNPKELRKTAYHEAGHALVSYLLPTPDPVHQISIIPAGRALGYTLNVPTEDKQSEYREELKEEISVLLAGRAAEVLTFGDFSGGASNDIERATNIARKMVTQLGMSDELGPIRYGQGGGDVFLGRDFSARQDYSGQTAAKIDAEIHKIVTDAYEVAKKLLSENASKLEFVAEYLFTHEIMDGDQFKCAMEADEPTVEALEEIAAEKKRKSEEANARRRAEEEKARAEKERLDREAFERIKADLRGEDIDKMDFSEKKDDAEKKDEEEK